jgi:hypothetical protein
MMSPAPDDSRSPFLPDEAKGRTLRFTADGSDALDAHLAQTCRRVRAGVRRVIPRGKLEAVLLGGGYGRGEGGVLHTAQGDQPYNDLEFYVLVRGSPLLNDWRYRGALRALAHELTPGAGVEVEFKILSLARLRRSPVTMFSYDLVLGHRWVCGQEDLLAGCAHHRQAGSIPLAEATRLLMNRCSGLLFARERLLRTTVTAEDIDFAGRNLAKARLALGDVVLAVRGLYHWSCRERGIRLERLLTHHEWPWLPAVCAHHRRGVEFKLHPVRTVAARGALLADFAELSLLASQVWVWLESTRLRARFRTPLEYVASQADKCPESPGWRNRLVNLLHFGPGGLLRPAAGHYPRERLLHALPLLLWEPAALVDGDLHRYLRHNLRTSASRFAEFVQAYARLWERFR